MEEKAARRAASLGHVGDGLYDVSDVTWVLVVLAGIIGRLW